MRVLAWESREGLLPLRVMDCLSPGFVDWRTAVMKPVRLEEYRRNCMIAYQLLQGAPFHYPSETQPSHEVGVPGMEDLRLADGDGSVAIAWFRHLRWSHVCSGMDDFAARWTRELPLKAIEAMVMRKANETVAAQLSPKDRPECKGATRASSFESATKALGTAGSCSAIC